MVTLNPYPRGFIIHPRTSNITPPDGWSTVKLENCGWEFSHDPLEVPEIIRVEGTDQWILVQGLCLHAGLKDIEASPAQHLANMLAHGLDQFLDALDFLGGRHVILLGDSQGFRVFNDATGMRSVYVSPESSLLASHVNLIQQISPHEARNEAQGLRGAIAGWDRTPYLGISPLLPNHYLSVPDWSTKRYYPRRPNQYLETPLEEKIALVRRMWNREMANLVATGAQLVMSITGGADSRTSLALSMEHIDDIDMFTYTVPSSGSSKWAQSMSLDNRLVEEIKTLVPFKHQYFNFKKEKNSFSDNINKLLEINSIQNHGRALVPHYAKAFPADNVVHLRGNAYEIGRAYWGTTDKNDSLSHLRLMYLYKTRADAEYEDSAQRTADFHRGVQTWEYDTDLHGFHMRDLFYWENRSGRWLAEILNETDIAFQTCVPLNVRSLIEITLSFPVKQREDGYFFAELINAAYPVLNFPGKNDPRNLYESSRDRELDLDLDRADKDSKYLLPEITVSRPDGTSETVETDVQELYIPAEEFTKGTEIRKKVNSAQRRGTLTFCVVTDYFRPEARNHWQYRLVVDDQTQLTWDGALQGRDVHVAIDNVGPETDIQLVAVALQNQAGKSSWENATKTVLRNFALSPRGAKGLPQASADASDVIRRTESIT